MAENFNLGRVRPEFQNVFLGTGKLLAVQGIDVTKNFAASPLNYLGINQKQLYQIMDGQQYSDVNFNCSLVNSDFFYPLTGEQPSNFFILRTPNDMINNYCLLSGYMTKYSTKYSIGQVPQTQATVRFYGNAGKLNTGSLDNLSLSQLTQITSNSYQPSDYLIPYGGSISLNLNEYITNRVLEYNIDITINRIPIYQAGNRAPLRVDIISPIVILCSFTFDLGNYSGTALRDFPSNKQMQNISISLNDYNVGAFIYSYNFSGMTLIDEKYTTQVDNNVSVTKNFIGYYF